jgi:hypothetical protein
MAGNLSGNTIRIITYPAIKLSTELTPKHFGSTGELAMSGNGEHFAVVSWFLSAYVARHDVAIPRNSTPVMLVYTLGMKSPTAIIPLKALGLSSNTWTDVLRPSLSDDGRSIAVAQNGSIDVFSGEVSNSLPK